VGEACDKDPDACRPGGARRATPQESVGASLPAAPGPLPDAMRTRLDLRREQVRASLRKHGAARSTARVVLVLDASASMAGLYARGVVCDVVERMAAVVAELDEDATARAWTFATHPARLPDLTLARLPEWLGLHVRPGQLGLLGRPRRRGRGLHPEQVDMRLVGVHNEEHRVLAEVRAYVREHPDPRPTLVLFFSDGGVRRDAEIARQLREAAREPLFWQFVGLGRAHYGVLTRFGPPHGRRGNAGFFAVDDVSRTPDEELYDRVLAGFPAWLGRL
jgi:hypothetical protein